MKLLHVMTVPMSLTFLRGQVGFMRDKGMTVHVLSSPGTHLEDFGKGESVTVHAVRMTRRITPLQDLVALARIWRRIRTIRPMIVHAHTPKGGLLGMLAAFLAGTPVRVYQMRGLPFTAATGLRRIVSLWAERVSCMLADLVLCNSMSMRQIAVQAGICAAEKCRVLGQGSGNGVDAAGRFDPERLPPRTRALRRAGLGIPEESIVVGFVGRLVKDKGVADLYEAWRSIRAEFLGAYLVMVGPMEDEDPLPREVEEGLRRDPRVRLTGMDWNTPPLYEAMDLVVLPSYREGFPNVLLEAASMRRPVIATQVVGCIDAVEAGKTGILVPAKDVTSLTEALRTYLNDAGLRSQHGEAGRKRVLRLYRQEDLWGALHEAYTEAAASRGSGKKVMKRALDLFVSIAGLVALSPLLAAVALFVLLRMGRPILFSQERVGQGGRVFKIIKFRSMADKRTGDGSPLSDEKRLEPFGQFLRRTSLDELPELWNVLKGEMALVGPRPLLPEYLPLYSAQQARRHEVRPGITGWAQVNGRNATTWEKRLALDVWYVDNWSMKLDLRILLLTLKKVALREGISQDGSATMERFRGSTV